MGTKTVNICILSKIVIRTKFNVRADSLGTYDRSMDSLLLGFVTGTGKSVLHSDLKSQ